MTCFSFYQSIGERRVNECASHCIVQVLVGVAVDLITHIFEHSSSTKYELCRVFCKFGLLQPLVAAFARAVCGSGGAAPVQSSALQQIVKPVEAAYHAPEVVTRIANILYVFSRGMCDALTFVWNECRLM
jgi:hypothetical protein